MRNRWGQWCVWGGSGSALYDDAPEVDGSWCHGFDTEDEALAYMKTRRDDYFEYGHQAITVEEQREALWQLITDAQGRLDRLNATGSQWEEYS